VIILPFISLLLVVKNQLNLKNLHASQEKTIKANSNLKIVKQEHVI